MVKTIGNPLTWLARGLAGSTQHIGRSMDRIGGETTASPEVLPLSLEDIRSALRSGYADFGATRADVMFICIIYPVIGVFLAAVAFNANLLQAVFPVAGGFTLLGPFFAVGLYEVSRRREAGQDVSWLTALGVVRSPNFGAVLVLGLYLAAIFFAWIVVAQLIWFWTLGPDQPDSLADFARQVLTTGAGWVMIIVGMTVGFCFALAVLATSVVSFPLLLDRNVGVPIAVRTSFQVFRKNPRVISIWGLVVAILLLVGSIPFFVGLVIVLPVLGHGTWHLYRRAVKV